MRRLDINPNLSTIPSCACGEPLDHEDEQEAGQCWNCQAEAAGFIWPEPRVTRLLTRAQVDEICGVSHRRRAS